MFSDPEVQHFVSEDRGYVTGVAWPEREGQFTTVKTRGGGGFVWPDCCCRCLGPMDVKERIKWKRTDDGRGARERIHRTLAYYVPYCDACAAIDRREALSRALLLAAAGPVVVGLTFIVLPLLRGVTQSGSGLGTFVCVGAAVLSSAALIATAVGLPRAFDPLGRGASVRIAFFNESGEIYLDFRSVEYAKRFVAANG